MQRGFRGSGIRPARRAGPKAGEKVTPKPTDAEEMQQLSQEGAFRALLELSPRMIERMDKARTPHDNFEGALDELQGDVQDGNAAGNEIAADILGTLIDRVVSAKSRKKELAYTSTQTQLFVKLDIFRRLMPPSSPPWNLESLIYEIASSLDQLATH